MAYRKTYTCEEFSFEDLIVDLSLVYGLEESLENNLHMRSSFRDEWEDSYSHYYANGEWCTSSSDDGNHSGMVIALAKVRMEHPDLPVEMCPLSHKEVMVRYGGHGEDVTNFETAFKKYCKDLKIEEGG